MKGEMERDGRDRTGQEAKIRATQTKGQQKKIPLKGSLKGQRSINFYCGLPTNHDLTVVILPCEKG